MARYLVFHDGEVVASAATAKGAELTRNVLNKEHRCGRSQGWRAAWPILGPFPGDPEDPTNPMVLAKAA